MPIHIKNLTIYERNSSKTILDHLDCTINDQQITLIIGKTGAGKSTFLDAISGLIEIDSGFITYDEQPLWGKHRPSKEIILSTGNVFQSPWQQLFARTVDAEFIYSLKVYHLTKEEIEKRITSTLVQVGLPQTVRNDSTLTLSEGQKRRVALGSTFATEPKWLFLDEPTSGLDSNGAQRIVDYLLEQKKRIKGGIIIVTHDLDTFLPVADQVIVMQDGHIVAQMQPVELCAHPDVLLSADIGYPHYIELIQSLRQFGLPVPLEILSAKDMATWLLMNAIGIAHNHHIEEGEKNLIVETQSGSTEISSLALPEEQLEHLAMRLDPRAKWLIYIMFSFGIFYQSDWIGLIFPALLTTGAVVISRVSYRKIGTVTKPFLFLIGISFLLSGLQFGHQPSLFHVGEVGFNFSNGLVTLLSLSKILLIMILGGLLSATTSPLQVKRSLEQPLSLLPMLRVPVEAFSLATMLIFRFIPIIFRETNRFSKITRARAKHYTKQGTITFTDIVALIIPLLLSVLQLGSDLVLAMESRGYQRIGMERTSSTHLHMKREDYIALCIGLLSFVFLLLAR
ncbi:MAG: ATP-binding cassette domain-containing protein [Acidibacillus sp.]|nr:ATP-binding cassette domain-containing protein [Acidibacillus sp.]